MQRISRRERPDLRCDGAASSGANRVLPSGPDRREFVRPGMGWAPPRTRNRQQGLAVTLRGVDEAARGATTQRRSPSTRKHGSTDPTSHAGSGAKVQVSGASMSRRPVPFRRAAPTEEPAVLETVRDAVGLRCVEDAIRRTEGPAVVGPFVGDSGRRVAGSAPGRGVGPGIHLLLHSWCRSFTGRRSWTPRWHRCTRPSAFAPACSGEVEGAVAPVARRKPRNAHSSFCSSSEPRGRHRFETRGERADETYDGLTVRE